jgi:hypothetical protein
MRRKFVVAICFVAFVVGARVANACGDKLLALGRGVRFQRAYKAPYPGNILVLWRIDPQNPNSGKDLQFRALLTGVGHKVTMAYNPEDTKRALQTQQFDLVLFEFEDEIDVDSSLATIDKRPSLLPILYQPSKADMRTTRAKYHWVIKAPVHPGQLLAAIDDVMDQRSKQGLSTLSRKR